MANNPETDNGGQSYNASRRTAHRPASSLSGSLSGFSTGSTTPSGNGSSGSTLVSLVKAQISFLMTNITEDNIASKHSDVHALIDAHGQDSQHHYLRRLFLACSSYFASPSSSPSSTLISPGSAAVTPQTPLYWRLLCMETAELANDPSSVERYVLAIQSGLNDPSASTSDTFRAIDIRLLIEKLALEPFPKVVLLLELAQLALPDTIYGTKATSAIVTAKRRAFGQAAALLLRDERTITAFIESLETAILSPAAASRLAATILSDYRVNNSTSEARVARIEGEPWSSLFNLDQIRGALQAMVRFFGADAASHIFMDACGSSRVAKVEEGETPEDLAAILIRRVAVSDDVFTLDLLRTVFDKTEAFRFDTASKSEVQEIIAKFLGSHVLTAGAEALPLFVGQAFVDAINSCAQDAAIEDIDWATTVREAIESHCSDARPDELHHLQTLLSAQTNNFNFAPINALWQSFKRGAQQVELFETLVYGDYDFAATSLPPSATVIYPEDLDAEFNKQLETSTINIVAEHIGIRLFSAWNNSRLVPTLLALAGPGQASEAHSPEARVQALIGHASQAEPELVLLSMFKSKTPPSQMAIALSDRLLSMVIAGSPSCSIVFYTLAKDDRTLLVKKLKEFYNLSDLNVTRVLEIAHDFKLLRDILEASPDYYALDVAALAGRKEYIDDERWLESAVATHGSVFVRAALEFVGAKVRHDLNRQDQDVQQASDPTTVSLTASTIATFLRTLRAHHEIFGPEEIELFKEVRTQCLQLHPRLMNFAPGAEQEPGISVTSFTPDIEAEVDSFYKRMYDQEISVDDVVTLLHQAKSSDNTHDHDFLACFLHGLFDEYKFFSTYPQQELFLTASLFGSLIQHHLIDYIPLGIAVRYVLDALRNAPDSNWFRFGIQALSRFLPRLHEWPSLAQAILNVPHLSQTHPDIAAVARAALSTPSTTLDNGIVDTAVAEVDAAVESFKIFTALKPDVPTHDRGTPETPDEATSDRILFIINNLALSNLDQKVGDMQKAIESSYMRWFANYLVDQRISIEPNNHHLYMQFLDTLDIVPLFKEVLQETLIRAEELLNSEQTVQSSNQRTLLKNLGAWLGALTLAKNKPIKHKNVSFKDLLIQGYDSNRLIVAIPFVCKVLEQCSKSRVFRPPNPWLMAILRLLVELYHFAELKLNLKFEIEVLCKNINIDLKEIQPTTTLRVRPPKEAGAEGGTGGVVPEADRPVLTAAFPRSTTPSGEASQNQASRLPQLPSGIALLGSSSSGGGAAGYSLALADAITAALATVPQYLTFSVPVSGFSSNTTLRRLVQLGIDSAVREIIAPVVERSVTIAGISTRELAIKDFAMEGNEERMREAAHLMVQNLAGSLALVTCKEPLRLSIVTHLRTLLLQNGFTELNLPEQSVMIIANDNLDLACSVVEKVAMDRAVVEVDDALAPSYMARLKHRERSSQAFWDTAAMAASHYSGMLPDPLRLKLGGLQPSQMLVYEEFEKRASSSYPPQKESNTEEGPANQIGTSPAAQDGLAPGGLLTAQQATEIFTQLMLDLEKAFVEAEAADFVSLSDLPAEHDVHRVLRQLPIAASRSFVKDETTLGFSQKVVQLLYRSDSRMAREAFVLLLQRLCEITAKVSKEVTAWLIYAPDERKFNVPVTVLLLESGFIAVAEYDTQLAKFVMREFKSSFVNFAARLIRECLLGDRSIATREHFSHTLRALAQAVQAGKGGELAAPLLEDLRSIATEDAATKVQNDNHAIREQLTLCFVEWVRIYQSSFQIEKSFVEFVVQLQNQGILKGEEISSLFFRVCTEVSVEAYIKQKAAGATPVGGLFQPVDAFAKLITFMIKYHADPQNKNNHSAKVLYMSKVLSIVVLVLAQSHEELGFHFQQKPFYRFFSSLLANLHSIEMHLGTAYYQILVTLSHSINTLQPLYFSGFTFSWMALVSHRMFMPKLLGMKDREGWSSFHRLLISLLRFLAPFLRNGEVTDTLRTLYTGTLRIMLVLLHDFPEFLSVYYYSLSDVIPTSCTQLHNLLSSAFPLSTKLPDPLQITRGDEAAAENNGTPSLLSDFAQALQPMDVRQLLERKLQRSVELGNTTELSDKILAAGNGQSKYNEPMINSIVMFCCSFALAQSKAQTGTPSFLPSAPAVTLLQNLISELDPEGSYLILNAMAMHLRYPNAHSNWFSKWILHVFTLDGTAEYTKEQIVRVLLERLIAYRPHPYHIIATFVQMMQDDAFFRYSFVAKSPEVKLLLGNIRSSLAIPMPNGTAAIVPATAVVS